MRNILTALGILVFGLSLAVIVGKSKPEPDKTTEIAPPPPKVRVMTANPGKHAVHVKSHGVIEAKHKIDMLAEVSGRIIVVSPNFAAGGKFDTKEPLLQISPINYETALANAQASVAEAEQNLASERARAAQAKKEWRDLGQEDANALSLRKPQVATAEAKLQAAKAWLTEAEHKLGQTKLHMYFPVSIIETHVNLGQLLIEGNKVATLYATDKLQVSLPLTQAQLKTLGISWPLKQNEQLPEIQLHAESAGDTFQWQAKARLGSANIDSKNQMVTIIADIEGENLASALPGLYVEATISGIARDNVINVPDNAFHDKRFILVADSDNKVSFRDAEFLSRNGDNLLLKADIKAGEHIIIDRLPLAAPGLLIEPVQPSTSNHGEQAD